METPVNRDYEVARTQGPRRSHHDVSSSHADRKKHLDRHLPRLIVGRVGHHHWAIASARPEAKEGGGQTEGNAQPVKCRATIFGRLPVSFQAPQLLRVAKICQNPPSNAFSTSRGKKTISKQGSRMGFNLFNPQARWKLNQQKSTLQPTHLSVFGASNHVHCQKYQSTRKKWEILQDPSKWGELSRFEQPQISGISTSGVKDGTSHGAPRAPEPSARSLVRAGLGRPPRARGASQRAAPAPGGGIPSQRLALWL